MREQIQSFIQDDLLGGREISDQDELLMSGLIDSLGVMRLVAFIERSCGVSIPAGEVTIQNFKTLEAIVAYVEARMREAAVS